MLIFNFDMYANITSIFNFGRIIEIIYLMQSYNKIRLKPISGGVFFVFDVSGSKKSDKRETHIAVGTF